jgi:HK97 family phage major capsid protein
MNRSDAASTTTIAYDEVVDLEHSVDPEYRRNGKWMLSDKILARAKDKVKGWNRSLQWQHVESGGSAR